jgi:hypothetical protein
MNWQLTVGPVCSLRENLSVGAPHRYKRPCMAAAADNPRAATGAVAPTHRPVAKPDVGQRLFCATASGPDRLVKT